MLCLLSCSTTNDRVKGYVYDVELIPIRGGNKRAALYRFSYNDSIYTRVYTYSKISKWHYLTNDSVWVSIPNANPQKSKPDTIFFRPRKQAVELVIPAVNESNRITSYHHIAEEPVFSISDNAEGNKEKLREYMNGKKIEKNIYAIGIVGVDIIISKNGKIEEVKLLRSSKSNELDNFVIETLLSLPAGKPGKNKDGELEHVRLLMEFNFK